MKYSVSPLTCGRCVRSITEALQAVDHALSIAPNMAEAHYQKGSILHVQGDLAVQTLLWSDGAPGGLTVLGQCTAQVGLVTRGSAP